jgi:effector-binding domain-containing protein
MEPVCEHINRDATPSVVIRTRSSVEELPQVIGAAYQRIATFLGTKKLAPAGPPYVAYHNEDMQDLDLEIGFPLAEELKGEGEFEASSIPGGEYATTLHIGPYSKFEVAYNRLTEVAYNRLTQWIGEQSLQPAGSCYEIYLNDPVDTHEDELQTLILFPIE